MQRVTRESTSVVTAAGNGRTGASGSNRGRRHAKATRAKVNVTMRLMSIPINAAVSNRNDTARSAMPVRVRTTIHVRTIISRIVIAIIMASTTETETIPI